MSNGKIARIGSNNRAAAEQICSAIYGPSLRAAFSGQAGEFSVNYTHTTLGQSQLVKCEVRSFACSRVTERTAQIFVPLRGQLNHKAGRNTPDVLADQSTGVVVRPGVRTEHKAIHGAALILTLEVSKIASRAEELLGHEVSVEIISQMANSLDLTAPIPAAIARNMKSTFSEILALDGVGISALAASGYEEVLLNLATVALFPEAFQEYAKSQITCGASLLTQARDYIYEHATEPLVLAELAASLGISMRTMQINFQRQFGVSPREYLMQVRLEKVHQTLLLGDPSIGVTEAAYQCGFANLGYFASKYRDRFGELPSETLRVSRN